MDIDKLLGSSGLLDCIDDAYLARGDWMPLVEAFARLVAEAEREACAVLCDEEATAPRNSWEEKSMSKNLSEYIRARSSN